MRQNSLAQGIRESTDAILEELPQARIKHVANERPTNSYAAQYLVGTENPTFHEQRLGRNILVAFCSGRALGSVPAVIQNCAYYM